MNFSRYSLPLLLASLLVVAGLTGCASPAERSAMVPTGIQLTKKFDASVSVKTGGGNETGAMDSSNISDADLKAAIEDAIAQNGVFKRVVQGAGGDYELSVSIVQLDKPMFGASFTVNLEAAWSLVKLADRSVALRKSIRSSHTATMGDAVVGVTRLRLAVEGAVRKNIEQGLQDVSQLAL
jgi:hypothetical protein